MTSNAAFNAMNAFRREEHTLLGGRYYSSATHLITMPTGCYAADIRSAVPMCDKCQTEKQGMTSNVSRHVSPLQLLNDGFDANHASCEDEKRQETRYTDQKQVQRRRRISSLWKPCGSRNLVDPHGAPQIYDSVDSYESHICPCSFGKHLESLPDGSHRPKPLHYSSRRYSHCISRKNAPHDVEKVQEAESVHPSNEMLALLEDDFIAFACRKETNPLQRNFMIRALLNLLCKLS